MAIIQPIRTLTTVFLFAGLLLGCGEPYATGASNPRSLMPKDSNIAQLYQRSCYACHVNDSSRAPLTGDQKAWEPRLAQGMEQLLTHVIDGYKGMPPLGMCMDCSAQDFEALIRFMATPATAPVKGTEP